MLITKLEMLPILFSDTYISSLASKCQHFKLKNGHPNFKVWHFEASEDIMTKFKSQGFQTIRIKY